MLQFSTTTENGFIRIPDEYKVKIGSRVKVTIVNDDKPETDWDKLFPPVVDTGTWKFSREEANVR
jgi:hypothetical protein